MPKEVLLLSIQLRGEIADPPNDSKERNVRARADLPQLYAT